MRAIIITIGDELLIGQVVDTNSAWIGQQLNDTGVDIVEKLSISDTEEAIQHALRSALSLADVLLITGGLGPTKDDITKKAIAAFMDDQLVFHDPTWQRIQRMFARWGRSTTDAHYQQCYMPSKASLLPNKMGTAPGMFFQIKGKKIISMPGVPYEMKYIMKHSVLPMLASENGKKSIIHRTIRTVGEGESRIADRIQAVVDAFPDYLKIAYLPSLGQVRLRITGFGTNKEKLLAEVNDQVEKIIQKIPELVFGYDNETLEAKIGQICLEKNKKIGTAESCTGGRIAHRITSISGSSAYFMGSIVAYDNQVKENLLKVKPDTLLNHGAVSKETVVEMVAGLLDVLPIDIAVAISGIAGPSGGTPGKPVGTIWVACGNRDKTDTLLLKAGKDRAKNIDYASTYALNLLRKFLVGLE